MKNITLFILLIVGIFIVVWVFFSFSFKTSQNNITVAQENNLKNEKRQTFQIKYNTTPKEVKKLSKRYKKIFQQEDIVIETYGLQKKSSSDNILLKLQIGNQEKQLKLPVLVPDKNDSLMIIKYKQTKFELPGNIFKNINKDNLVKVLLDLESKKVISIHINKKQNNIIFPLRLSDLPSIIYYKVNTP